MDFISDAAAAMEQASASAASWEELVFWKELAQQNSSILERELARRHELEYRNEELESKWDGLRDELEKLRATREAAEEEAARLAASLTQVSKQQRESEQTVNELESIWAQSSAKFKEELERLERERKKAEKKRMEAEKGMKSASGGARKLTDQNRRLKEQLNHFTSLLQAEEARNQESTKLKQLNTLLVKRVDEMKKEVNELKTMLDAERDQRLATEVFSQVDAWQSEAKLYNMERTDEALAVEKAMNALLQKQLDSRNAELQTLRQELTASAQSATHAEIKLFAAECDKLKAEEATSEALMHAARCQEAMEDANRQKDEAYKAVQKMMAERQAQKKDFYKAQGERDFLEWMLLEKATPKVVEWIEPGEQTLPVVHDDGTWHENTLFGHANELYSSD